MWTLIMVVMLGNSEPIDSPVKTFETEKQCYTHLSKLELSYKNSQFAPPALRCETASVKTP
jgi:hypothetical protein